MLGLYGNPRYYTRPHLHTMAHTIWSFGASGQEFVRHITSGLTDAPDCRPRETHNKSFSHNLEVTAQYDFDSNSIASTFELSHFPLLQCKCQHDTQIYRLFIWLLIRNGV